jgi:hypothetical protein
MLPRLIAMISLLWAGMILGISFLESWVKFRAPSLTKAVGLDVGRTVFHSFHKVQCILFFIIIVTCLSTDMMPADWLMLSMLAIMLIIQILWLFPMLNRQVTIILAGGNSVITHEHTSYGIVEITKFLMLVIFSLKFIFL